MARTASNPRIQFDAIVDGWVVPEQPAKIFAGHKQSPVPILRGSNADEAIIFSLGVKTLDQYKKYLQQDTGKFADQEFAVYPASSDAQVAAQYLQLQNDSFAYAACSMALNVTRSGQPAYLDNFRFAQTGKNAHLGAHHGLELNFLADSYPPDWEHRDADRKLGEYIRGYWAQFAKTGDPNDHRAPAWPRFSSQADQLLELGHTVRAAPSPLACMHWPTQ
jgi:para-nitrobenzyl esterase